VIEGDLARIHKQGHVEGGPGLPSVLGGQEQAVEVTESKLPETSQLLPASQRRHVVERYGVSGAEISHHQVEAQSDHRAFREGEILL